MTTSAGTLLDLAAVLDEHESPEQPSAPKRSGSPARPPLEALAARSPGRPGAPAIKRLLDAGRVIDIQTRSTLERRFLTLLDAECLPRPLVNACTDRFEPDLTWPAQRLIVELDGYETHGTRAAFERDRARDRTLQAHGWRVIRITWRQLHDDPHTIAADLRALLTTA